ncbi:MAG: hypothetical protein K2X80_13660 [Pseudomonadaceae bacterium]|nr:hypothetical protein [Pseudomonadaceae bacterium]
MSKTIMSRSTSKGLPVQLRRSLLALGCTLLAVSSSNASAEPSAASKMPDSALYIGFGASANSVDFNDQDIQATGISDTYDTTSGALLASGSAGGPAVDLSMDSQSSLSPTLQLGYFQHFDNSQWLWGAKFSYNYLSTSSTTKNFLIPQYGAFGATPFTGNAVVHSFETEIKHQISLVPYIGHSFANGFVYAGAGPTLSQINTKIDGLIGFADINGTRTDISGQPSNFSSSQWSHGGIGTLGGTYFLDSSWFLDFNYNYAVTENRTARYSEPFTNPTPTKTYTGTLIGSTSGSVTTQSVALSINKAF